MLRKTVFTLVFISTGLLSFSQKIKYDTIPYALDYHQQRLDIFKKESLTRGKIIFLGDSHIEFGDWKKHLKDSSIINRGVAGDNTFGVLARLQDVTDRQPSKVFICIGINDVSKNIPEEVIVKNIVAMAKRIKQVSPKTQIFVHSILPTNDAVKKEYPDAYNKNDRARQVNDQLKSHALKNGFTYVDLYSKVQDKDGKLNPAYAYEDGLHLNANGYKLWIEILKSKGYL
jgi:lysophospholipase L1-like esterase